MLAVDFETRSAASIKAGAAAYARHPSTRVLCAVLILRLGGAEHRCRWLPGDELPSWAVDYLRTGGPVLAHNCAFEAAILRWCKSMDGWPTVKAYRWADTAERAALYGLPRSLDALGAALGCDVRKDMQGKALMLRLCDASGPEPTAAELERLLDYCEIDVRATLEIARRLPAPTQDEAAIARADRAINERGFAVDLQLVRKMRLMAELRKRELDELAFAASDADLVSVHAAPVVLRYLRDAGVEPPLVRRVRANGDIVHTASVDRATVAKLLAKPDLPESVAAVLRAREESGKLTSLAKLAKVADVMSPDGRVRGALRYCGAHTGRWSSTGLQVHNLPKSKLKGPQRDAAVRAILDEDIDALRAVCPDVLGGLSQLLRSVIVASEGHELIGADYSAIEARVLAWLAGEAPVLELFAAGRDVYVADAAAIGSPDRQLGKVARLGLGYGMGPLKFIDAAKGYGIQLGPRQARQVVAAFRAANPRIVAFWRDLEDAAKDAIREPGVEFEAGPITACVERGALRLRLPSGRELHYWRPTVRAVTKRVETLDANDQLVTREVEMQEISFFTGAGDGMVPDSTYGGKLVENVTQAVARDLLGDALVRLEGSEYRVVVHVHDSIAAEVPIGDGSVDEFCRLMVDCSDWALGLPLAAEGYRARCFKG